MRFLVYMTLVLTIHATALASKPPNLIIILTDDQGYADVGFNGCKDIPTPHIDRIADEGVRFTNGYVSYSVCGPSRAGLITGRYQDRFGFSRNPSINPNDPSAGLPLSERTMADVLHDVGYKTMAVGKWHLGTHDSLRPRKRGFDEFFGFLSGGHRYFPDQLDLRDIADVRRRGEWYRTKLLHNGERIEMRQYLTDELSDAAVEFVDRNHASPFFLYLAYNAPHTPMQASEKYLARFPNIKDQKRQTYAAMISAVDDGVGRLLDKLQDHQLVKETIVVFLSDNGGPIGPNGSRNDPLRGKKGTLFEGGIRVPFAMRWTGHLPAGTDYDEPIISLDIFATIAALNDLPVDPQRPLDGVNLIPYLTEEIKTPPHDALYWRMFDRNTTAMRQADTKIIRQAGKRSLFDLSADMGESDDRMADRTEEWMRMSEQLDQWNSQLKEPAFEGLNSWPKRRARPSRRGGTGSPS